METDVNPEKLQLEKFQLKKKKNTAFIIIYVIYKKLHPFFGKRSLLN